MRLSPLWLALAASAPAGALRLSDAPAAGALAAGSGTIDPTFGTDANATTKFLFLTHHKTGTNLFMNLCRKLVPLITNKTEVCHVCYRAQKLHDNGTLQCPRNSYVKQDSGFGTEGRFMVITAIDDKEFRRIQDWSKSDYRVIHMVRDPVEMLVSDFWYNDQLYSRQLNTLDATMKASVWEGKSTVEDKLRNVSYVLSHFVDHMCSLREANAGDPNMLTMDLDLFKKNFSSAARQMFSFMLGRNYSRMDEVMKAASPLDLQSNSRERQSAYVSDVGDHHAVMRAKVLEMIEAKDETILASTSCEGAKVARPWARRVVHFGDIIPPNKAMRKLRDAVASRPTKARNNKTR